MEAHYNSMVYAFLSGKSISNLYELLAAEDKGHDANVCRIATGIWRVTLQCRREDKDYFNELLESVRC